MIETVTMYLLIAAVMAWATRPVSWRELRDAGAAILARLSRER